MESVTERLRTSPTLIRFLPFAVILLLTASQGTFGRSSAFWMYGLKTLVGALAVWFMFPVVKEMRWKFSWEAVVAGVAVFILWVGLDPFYKKWGSASVSWNPFAFYGDGSAWAWFFVVVRIAGSTLVVPPLEEVFYRSFLYRYLIRPDFTSVPLNQFHPTMFCVTAIVFGVAHFEWLAGILCAVIYHGLIIRRNRLGDAMTAHAITNFLLGLWVVGKGAWNFW